MKSSKKQSNDNLNAQINDLRKNSVKLTKEIKDLQPPLLAPDEAKIIEKIREAVNVWGYDVVKKNENMLLYKKRELQNINALIKKNEEMLI